MTYDDGTDLNIPVLHTVTFNTIGGKSTPNRAPNFSKATEERSIDEDETVNRTVGDPVVAPDEDNTTLTYSLTGADAAFFSIDPTRGQISVRPDTRLDHETKSVYRVTVAAEDPNGLRDRVTVNIRVDDANESPVITSGYGTIYYAENGTGTVGTYVVTDPERDSTTWTLLASDDSDLFTIDGGLLKFKAAPDYEAPFENGDNTYNVTVQASDGPNDAPTMAVVVKVTNVDEAGTVSGLPERPKQVVPIEARLRDLDSIQTEGSDIDINSWQWARSSSRTGSFTDIDDVDDQSQPLGQDRAYIPTENDVGKYLRVTATYRDPQGAGKSANATSTQATERADYSNNPPQFLDDEEEDISSSIRSVKENSPPGTKVGNPVAATDLDRNDRQERLTYRLSGNEATFFTIDTTTGQIRVKSGTVLDYEAKSSYAVTITATDPSDQGDSAATTDQSRDTISVTINVENVDETPKVTVARTEGVTGTPEGGYKRNEPIGDSPTRMRIEFAGDDPEITGTDNTDEIKWTLTGTDAEDFSIGNYDNTAGVLTFKEDPDFEAPIDSNRNNVYELTVQATDEGGNTVSQSVKVTVENVEEDGTITFSHIQPEIGTRFTATLTDPDRPSGVTWQWYTGVPSGNNIVTCDETTNRDCRIGSATSASYTPTGGDDGQVLTVRASYRDGEGTEKSAQESTDRNVDLEDENNEDLQFERADGTRITADSRDVDEGAVLNRTVGVQVAATDKDMDGADDNSLVYTLSGTDAASFSIDNLGQIRNQVPLDFETKKRYTVVVKAVDPGGENATITITIDVQNVDESPEVSTKGLVAVGTGFISYEENGTGVVAGYTATGSRWGQCRLEPRRTGCRGLLNQPEWATDLQEVAQLRSACGRQQGQHLRNNDHGTGRQRSRPARRDGERDQPGRGRGSVAVPGAHHRRRPSHGYTVGHRRHADRSKLGLGEV